MLQNAIHEEIAKLRQAFSDVAYGIFLDQFAVAFFPLLMAAVLKYVDWGIGC